MATLWQRILDARLGPDRDLLFAQKQQQQNELLAQQQAQSREAVKAAVSPFGAETAAQLGPLLTSGDPQLQNVGNQMLAGLMQQRAALGQGPSLEQQRLELDQQREERLSQIDPMALQRLAIAREAEDRKRLQAGRLPVGQVEAIIEQEAMSASLESSQAAMRPEYFGFGLGPFAEATREYKTRFGDDVPFVTFWQDMDTRQAQLRHELFGASLTTNEQRAWDRLAIKPTDSFAAAAGKLKAQQATLSRKRGVRESILQQGGYNVPPTRPSLESLLGAP